MKLTVTFEQSFSVRISSVIRLAALQTFSSCTLRSAHTQWRSLKGLFLDRELLSIERQLSPNIQWAQVPAMILEKT